MPNEEKYAYYLTGKQARTVIDALSVQHRFFNKHLKKTHLCYIRKLKESLELQHRKVQMTSHEKPMFQGLEIKL